MYKQIFLFYKIQPLCKYDTIRKVAKLRCMLIIQSFSLNIQEALTP